MSSHSNGLMYNTRPLNIDAASIRREMLERLVVPADLVTEAFRVTRAKLTAKEIKFFAHKGEIVDQREVEDHDSQLRAADQIYNIAGLYTRERESVQPNNTVAIEVDPSTGVMRLVIGSSFPIASHNQDEGSTLQLELPPASRSPVVVESKNTESLRSSLKRIILDEEVE